jgi:antitoxin (DNA-binding transcriptional repressor) of toxin-antitoxin stability system
MRTITLEELERQPGAFVRLAAGGETLLVAEGGTVIAEIRPAAGAGDSDDPLAVLARRDLIRRRAAEAGPLPTVPRPSPLAAILCGLDEDRAER